MKISELKILLKKMVEKYCRLKSLLYICRIETKKKKKDYEKFRIKKQSSSEIRSIWI